MAVTDQHGHSVATPRPWLAARGPSLVSTFRSLSDGDVITYTVTARDGAGNEAVVQATASKDTVAPSVSITSYTNPVRISNVTSAGASGTREDGCSILLTIADQHGNSVSGSDTGSGTTWSVSGRNLTGFVDGDIITFTARATDSVGNEGTDAETGVKDTVAPWVSVTARTDPINAATVTSAGAGGGGEDGLPVVLTVTDEHGHTVGRRDRQCPAAPGPLPISISPSSPTATSSPTPSPSRMVRQHHHRSATATKDTVPPAIAITAAPRDQCGERRVVIGLRHGEDGRVVAVLTVTDRHGHPVPGTRTRR